MNPSDPPTPAPKGPIVAAIALIVLVVGIGIIGSRGDSAGSAEADSTVSTPTTFAHTTSMPATSTTDPITVAEATSTPTTPPLDRTLSQGLAGEDVRMVQQRLVDLGFDPGPVDGIYGSLTTQAVWAFEKLVMRTPRGEATGRITPEAWQVLGNELIIAPRRSTNGQTDHTEVYLTEQVLIVFHKDVPALISHISSGELDDDGTPATYCETATYDTDAQGRELEEPVTKEVCAEAKTPGGVFTYKRQVQGKRVSPLGGMWDPVYFNYGIAVHGAENVPLEPASHGCVRIPMHISEYFQDVISLGDRILVWNGDKEPEDISRTESLPSFDYPDPNATTTTTTTVPPSTTTTTEAPAPETTEAPPTTNAPAPTTTDATPTTDAPSTTSTPTTVPATTAAPTTTLAPD